MRYLTLSLTTLYSALTAWTFAYLATVAGPIMGQWFTLDCWCLTVLALTIPLYTHKG